MQLWQMVNVLFEDASNLASFLYFIKNTQEECYEQIVAKVQCVIPFFKDFILEPNPLNRENIRLEWRDIYSDKILNANDFSDGSLRFICLAALLLQLSPPAIVLLDEPELGLHPSTIKIVKDMIRLTSFTSQVIVSTQSVSLVNEFKAEEIIVVEKLETETVFKKLDSKNLGYWMKDYSLGDLTCVSKI